MRHLYILLAHHGVMQRGINTHVSQQTLNLFDRHPFVNGHGRQSPTKLVWMYMFNLDDLPEFSYSAFHSADL